MATEQATKQYCEHIKLKQELIKRGGTSLAYDAVLHTCEVIEQSNDTDKCLAAIKEVNEHLAAVLMIIEDGQRDVEYAVKQLDKLHNKTGE